MTFLSHAQDRARCEENAGTTAGESGSADDGIDDTGKDLDPSGSESNDERTLFRSTGRDTEIRVIRRNDQSDDEHGEDVEDEDAPESQSKSARDDASRVSGFCSGESDDLDVGVAVGCTD